MASQLQFLNYANLDGQPWPLARQSLEAKGFEVHDITRAAGPGVSILVREGTEDAAAVETIVARFIPGALRWPPSVPVQDRTGYRDGQP